MWNCEAKNTLHKGKDALRFLERFDCFIIHIGAIPGANLSIQGNACILVPLIVLIFCMWVAWEVNKKVKCQETCV